jgi:single-strand DNA-binding protein
MNHCILMVEVTQAPQLRYTSDNQTPVVEFMVKIPGLRPEDPPAQIKAVGWGNLAQDIQAQYQPGDRLLIEGRLSIKTYERPEGFKEKQVELTAQRLHRLSDLQAMTLAETPVTPTMTSSSPPPAAAVPSSPAATEPEPDYDDIPF